MDRLGFESEDWSEDMVDWYDGADDMAEILREALDDVYVEASPDELDQALDSMLESMSPAEAFSFTKALGQIQRSAGHALSDPAFGQFATSVLPAAGGALGTVIGGPAGTALGASLGSAAAKALPRRPAAAGVATPAPTATVNRPVVGGSAAAAQGLVLTQQPDVLKSLLALAMGQHGQKAVSGVPVASIMNMLSSVFAQAAEDADELMYVDNEADAEGGPGYVQLPERAIYTALLDADNVDLAEALEAS